MNGHGERWTDTRWAIGLALTLVVVLVGWGVSVERRVTINQATMLSVQHTLTDININIRELNQAMRDHWKMSDK